MFCLDSDIIIDFLRGKRQLQSQDAVITVINAQEILFGLRKRPEQQERVRDFLDAIKVLPYEEQDVESVVAVKTHLSTKGTTIGILDEMIAGICIRNNLTLVTRNAKHFKKVKGLKVKKW